MANPMQTEAPSQARPAPPQWAAFLELGFRPLYVLGCLWAAVSVGLWVFAPTWLQGRLSGVVWHAHEMLWGFIATIAVGFLLTASGNWTGRVPLKGRALGGLSALWIVARASYLIPGELAFGLAAACELLFFAWAACALGQVIYGARNQRNYGVPLLVLGLGVANALYLLAAWQGDFVLLMQRFHTGLLCMAVLTLLVARRVIPFFAMRAIPGLEIPMLTRSGPWQLGAGGLAITCGLLGWRSAMALFLAVAGALALVQCVAWRPWSVRRVPLLWILYVGYAALGAGLLVAAAQASGWVLRAAWPVHVIGVAGFSVLIIGMVTRTALGHLGRPLRADRLMVCCYALVIVAATSRLLALIPSALTVNLLHASTTAWMLGFALYLWRFVPMMIRPRVNQADSALALKPAFTPAPPRAPQ